MLSANISAHVATDFQWSSKSPGPPYWKKWNVKLAGKLGRGKRKGEEKKTGNNKRKNERNGKYPHQSDQKKAKSQIFFRTPFRSMPTRWNQSVGIFL